MRNIFVQKKVTIDDRKYVVYFFAFHYKCVGEVSLLKLFDRWAIYKHVGCLHSLFGVMWKR